MRMRHIGGGAAWSRLITRPALVVVCLILLTLPCLAADQITFELVMSKWTVAENGTWVVDAEVTIRAPKDNPTHVVRVPLTWSGSSERLEVIQARIDKPDGRSVVMANAAVRDDPPTG